MNAEHTHRSCSQGRYLYSRFTVTISREGLLRTQFPIQTEQTWRSVIRVVVNSPEEFYRIPESISKSTTKVPHHRDHGTPIHHLRSRSSTCSRVLGLKPSESRDPSGQSFNQLVTQPTIQPEQERTYAEEESTTTAGRCGESYGGYRRRREASVAAARPSSSRTRLCSRRSEPYQSLGIVSKCHGMGTPNQATQHSALSPMGLGPSYNHCEPHISTSLNR